MTTKRKGVNTLGILSSSKDTVDVEKLLQGKDEPEAEEVKGEKISEEKKDYKSDEIQEKEVEKKLEVKSQEPEEKKPEGSGPEKDLRTKRASLTDYLERPSNFVKEKTENITVNASQRDLLKLLATLEGSQLNVVVYNIIDEFLENYDVKELASMIEKRKKKFL